MILLRECDPPELGQIASNFSTQRLWLGDDKVSSGSRHRPMPTFWEKSSWESEKEDDEEIATERRRK